jgi:hypothetical protein
MSSARKALAALSALAAALVPLSAAAPASAASNLDLTTSFRPFTALESNPWPLNYDIKLQANQLTQVFDPVLRVYLPQIRGTSASGVTVRTVLSASLFNVSVNPLNGFTCTLGANVVTCIGNIPASGSVTAATIVTSTPDATTPFLTTSTVDPGNAFAERAENNNIAQCNSSAVAQRC